MSESVGTKIDLFEGDVSIGRDVATGRDLSVGGDAEVSGSMKIGGWLDAKNLKTVNKGLFLSTDDLDDAYPLPEPGWWAVVGSSISSGDVYAVSGGIWVSASENSSNNGGGGSGTGTGNHAMLENRDAENQHPIESIVGLETALSELRSKFTEGAAKSAIKLETPRTIWGQEFDGTENIDGDIYTSGTVIMFCAEDDAESTPE